MEIGSFKPRPFQNKTYEGIAEGEVRIPVDPVSDGIANTIINEIYPPLSMIDSGDLDGV